MRTFLRAVLARRSLRVRIAAGAAAAAVAVLGVLTALTPALVGELLVRSVDGHLAPALADGARRVAAGQLRLGGTDLELRVLNIAGEPLDGGPPPLLSAAELVELESGVDVLREHDTPPHRWLGTVVAGPGGAPRLVLAGAGLLGYADAQRRAQTWMLAGTILGGLAVAVATAVAVRAALSPVQRMRVAARALPPGERLPVPASRDELRDLAESLNALLARRDAAQQRLQRFTGDAAHELRSPVASIRAQAEVGALYADPQTATEVLTDVVAEAERMSRLVSDLLVLARSDAGEVPLPVSVDLAFAAEAAVARVSTSDGPAVRLEVVATRCAVLATVAELELVLDNLLRNAVRHAASAVTVLVLPSGSRVRLVVDDDGDGVPAAHRGKVFDRFYRVADDRGRDSGGFGLGLALVAELVRRRGGTVAVGESPEGGARFDARWPAG